MVATVTASLLCLVMLAGLLSLHVNPLAFVAFVCALAYLMFGGTH